MRGIHGLRSSTEHDEFSGAPREAAARNTARAGVPASLGNSQAEVLTDASMAGIIPRPPPQPTVASANAQSANAQSASSTTALEPALDIPSFDPAVAGRNRNPCFDVSPSRTGPSHQAARYAGSNIGSATSSAPWSSQRSRTRMPHFTSRTESSTPTMFDMMRNPSSRST